MLFHQYPGLPLRAQAGNSAAAIRRCAVNAQGLCGVNDEG
jgi:hypothetical protein